MKPKEEEEEEEEELFSCYYAYDTNCTDGSGGERLNGWAVFAFPDDDGEELPNVYLPRIDDVAQEVCFA